MRFNRMPLEDWFDRYQYEIDYDIGESALSCLSIRDVGLDLKDVKIRYGHHRGSPLLREKIAETYQGLSPDNILVMNGGAEALFDLAVTLLDPGDHIIVQHPNYPSNYEAPRSLGCDVELFSLEFSRSFELDIERLANRIRRNTKVVSLTFPNNPTGRTINEPTLRQLVELIEKERVWLIFDETYRELAFDKKLPAAAELSERAISVSTLSKAYGVPGVRIGWIASQDSCLLERVLATREQVSICNSVIGEELALEILGEAEASLDRARRVILGNRHVLGEWVRQNAWLQWVEPSAGVVCFPRIEPGILEDPEELYVLLAEKYKTFVIPGRCFEFDNHYFRVGFGGDPVHLRIGLENINKAIQEVRERRPWSGGERGRRR